MLASITTLGWVLLVLAGFCIVMFVLWIVIQGAVSDAARRRDR